MIDQTESPIAEKILKAGPFMQRCNCGALVSSDSIEMLGIEWVKHCSPHTGAQTHWEVDIESGN